MRIVTLPVISLGLLAAGCASTTQFRHIATDTAAATAQYQAAFNDFITGQQGLNAADAEELAELSQATQREQARIDRQVVIWQLSDGGSTKTKLDVARQVSATDVLSSLTVTEAVVPNINDGGASASLASAQKQFVALGKKESLSDVLGNVLTTSGQISASLTALQERAKDKTTSTVSTVASKTQASK